jgi:hydrogenase expression/formation protein HypE
MKSAGDKVLLGHGSGGQMMHELINGLFFKYFGNDILNRQTDSAILNDLSSPLAFTTDSFVIDPLFFPGGNIGKLAVCGTVNDIAVSGAQPLYLSVSFIIEEGFPLNDLEVIVASLAEEAARAGVLIVTGDTKVVNKGKCDKLFINTAGIGHFKNENNSINQVPEIQPGDVIIINGTIGDHGMAVMNARESFNFTTAIESDCASLNYLIREIIEKVPVKFMRDPTRGGVATVLNELAQKTGLGIEINESDLPFNIGVKAICELLGFDPLHVANEGKVLIVAADENASVILDVMKKNEFGKRSSIIGRVVSDHPRRVVLKNDTGGSRILDSLSGDQLPRIC